MTEGEVFVAGLPPKTDFHDRSKRRSYDLARRVAVGIVDDPGLVRRGRDHMERHMGRDPRQARYHAMWDDLLREDPRVVAARMLEDSPRGDLLRDTQPVFLVPSPVGHVETAPSEDEDGPHPRP